MNLLNDSTLSIPRLFQDQKLLWLIDDVLDERDCTELIRRTARMSTSGGGNVSYRDQDRFVYDDGQRIEVEGSFPTGPVAL